MTIPARVDGQYKLDFEAWVESVRAVARRAGDVHAADGRFLDPAELAMVAQSEMVMGHAMAKVIRVIDQIEVPAVREHAYFAALELVSAAYAVGSCATVSRSASQALGVRRADHARGELSAQQERVAAAIRKTGIKPLKQGLKFCGNIRDQVRAEMAEADTAGGYPAASTLKNIITEMRKGRLGGLG